MGSGTTGVSCKNLNRNFIGIELDSDYFKIAEKRTECGINKNSAEDVAPSKMEHEGRMQISENKMKEINDYMAESKIIIEGLLKFLDKKYRKEILMELLQTECGMNENSAEDVAPYVEH